MRFLQIFFTIVILALAIYCNDTESTPMDKTASNSGNSDL